MITKSGDYLQSRHYHSYWDLLDVLLIFQLNTKLFLHFCDLHGTTRNGSSFIPDLSSEKTICHWQVNRTWFKVLQGNCICWEVPTKIFCSRVWHRRFGLFSKVFSYGKSAPNPAEKLPFRVQEGNLRLNRGICLITFLLSSSVRSNVFALSTKLGLVCWEKEWNKKYCFCLLCISEGEWQIWNSYLHILTVKAAS